jgi:CRP-like cAMP-binding protein
MSTDIDTEKFATVPLFIGLEQPEILKLLKLGENVAANKGDTIVREGEPGDGIYVIAAGAYEVRKKGAKEKVLARLEELSFFGEMSLVSDKPRAASVVCVTEGRLKKFPVAKFKQLLEAKDITAYKVIHNVSRILAERLSRLEERLVS